jgi:hypothetical protein
MRSLHTDSFRPMLVTLAIAITLVTAWLAWFFLARITIYEAGHIVGITPDGAVVADFPTATAEHIRVGQPAVLRLQGTQAGQNRAVPAVVSDVTPQRRADRVRVTLFALLEDNVPLVFPEGLAGNVEIEVEQVSPAEMITRNVGLPSGTAPKPASTAEQ